MKLPQYLYVRAYILSAVLSVAGCKKFLDKKNDDRKVVPTSIADLQALLDDSYVMNKATPNYGQASSDEYFVLENSFNSGSENDRNVYTWKKFEYVWPNDWSYSYIPVYTSNLCIERIQKVEKNSQNIEAWNNIKGAAHFFRGYFYLGLAWTFAKAYDPETARNDLGIVLRESSDFNLPSKRASNEETYNKIIEDVMAAILFLPQNSQHVMRPSKAAAFGLLARTYLSMRKYDSALKYSNLCLGLHSELMDLKNPGEGITDIDGFAPFKRFNPETIFYSEMSAQYSISLNFTALIDTFLHASYDDQDLRKRAFFTPSNLYQKFKGNYTGGYQMFTGIATDEMYLVRAECYARVGKKEEALQDLNSLLVKRHSSEFVPVTAATAEEALNIILKERQKELLQRGLRWSDLKRLNKENANITIKRLVAGTEYKLSPNDNLYALPLPSDIISNGKISQN